MKITAAPTIKLKLQFEIDEYEALGLDALVGYDWDAFTKTFKEHLGRHYLERPGAEQGLKAFFESCRKEIPQYLSKLEDAKKEFYGQKPNKNI